jgi:hypothetical protein
MNPSSIPLSLSHVLVAANGTVLSPHTASPLLWRALAPIDSCYKAKKVKDNGSNE